MKKLLGMILAACMLFAVTACSDKEQTSSVDSVSSEPLTSTVSSAPDVSSVEAQSSDAQSTVSSKPEEEKPVDLSTLDNDLKTLRIAKGALTQDDIYEAFEAKNFKSNDGTELVYRIYVPSSYDEKYDYPVLLFLHGAGERGSDNQANVRGMILNMFNYNIKQLSNCIVVAPQCPAGQQWVDTPWANGNYSIDTVAESNELKAVRELLKKVNSDYSTDKNRQYVTGLSMGGFGTWDLIMRHKELFTAAVPICGGADTAQAKALKDFPIFTVHGDADPTVPYKGTKDMADALKKEGSDITFITVENGGHGVWTHTAQNTEAYKWLFSQTK